MGTQVPVRTRTSRRIAADPTSTALLLAGPAAVELWPGVRRVAEAGGRTLVETLRAPVRAASVGAAPPLRTPTSYVSRFDWSGPGVPATTGTLTLSYVAGAAPDVPATLAVLELRSTDVPGSRLDDARLERLAAGFLDNLAQVAERRSDAA